MKYVNRQSIIALMFGLSACTSHNDASSTTGSDQPVVTVTDQHFVDARKKIMDGSVSIEQFEALIPGLKASDQPLTFNFDLTSAQAQQAISSVDQQLQNLAGDMITGSKNFTADISQDVLQQTLQWGDANITADSTVPDFQKIKTRTAKQNAALHDILNIYYTDAAKQADVIAKANIQAANDQVKVQITAARNLSGDQQTAALKQIIQDSGLDNTSNMDADKQEDAAKYVNAAALAYLQSNQDINNITVDNTVLVTATADIQVSIGAVQKFGNDYSAAMQKMTQASTDFSNALQAVKANLNPNGSGAAGANMTNSQTSQWIERVHKYIGIMNGKDTSSSNFQEMDPNASSYETIQSSSKIMGDAAQDVDAAATALTNAAKFLHLDPNTQKTVNQAAQIVSVGCKVVMGYLTGGPVGAAMAGLSAAGALSGGDATAAQNALINQKLDTLLKGQNEIIKLQQQTLKLQMDTLRAVADVALMIQKTQDSLSGIEGQLVSVSQGQTLSLLQNYENCIAFANVNTFGASDANYNLVVGAAVQSLLGNLTALDAKMSSADDRRTYQNCVKGLRDLYLNAQAMNFVNSLGANMTEHMLDQNGSLLDVDMQAQIYAPMRSIFEEVGTNPHLLSSVESYAQGLHLPIGAMSMAKPKYDLWAATASSQEDPFSDGLKLLENGFVYTPIVINNVKTIMQLVPMLTVLGEDGHWSAQDPFKTKDSDKTFLTILQNLMRLVQASIAQEDLVAGEPILDTLYSQFNDYLMEQAKLRADPSYVVVNTFAQTFFRQITDDDIANKNFDCQSTENVKTAGCLLRKNPYLAKNFVNYFIQRKLLEARQADVSADDLASKYKDDVVGAPDRATYSSLDVEIGQDNLPTSQLLHVFGQEFVDECVIATGTDAAPARRKFRIGGALLEAPTVSEYAKDGIVYTPNMRELIVIEKQLAAILTKMQKPTSDQQQMATWIANLYQITQ